MLLGPVIIPIISSGAGRVPDEVGAIMALLLLIGLVVGAIAGFLREGLPGVFLGSALGFCAGAAVFLIGLLVAMASRLFV